MLFVVPDFGKIEISAACGIAPTLRTGREEWGTHFFGRVREIESMGHPPYANVNRRLGLFNRYGDRDPGHAQALEEALDRLENATDNVKKKCDCDYYKAELAGAVAAATALAARVGEAIGDFCSQDPEVCHTW